MVVQFPFTAVVQKYFIESIDKFWSGNF